MNRGRRRRLSRNYISEILERLYPTELFKEMITSPSLIERMANEPMEPQNESPVEIYRRDAVESEGYSINFNPRPRFDIDAEIPTFQNEATIGWRDSENSAPLISENYILESSGGHTIITTPDGRTQMIPGTWVFNPASQRGLYGGAPPLQKQLEPWEEYCTIEEVLTGEITLRFKMGKDHPYTKEVWYKDLKKIAMELGYKRRGEIEKYREFTKRYEVEITAKEDAYKEEMGKVIDELSNTTLETPA